MRGDLHCHTRISDGSMSAQDVVDYAARIGLDCLAVTDHDSMEGVAAAQERAKIRGVRVLRGMEVSTFDYRSGRKAHLLCYRPEHPDALLGLCAQTLAARNRASLEIIEKVAARYPVDEETVRKYAAGSAAVYKQHIVMALMDRGFSLSIFGELFHELFSRDGGWARVDIQYPETREAMKLIKEAGGIAVLAHPGVYGNFELIPELCKMGLDGIEAYHPRQSQADEKAAVEAARVYGLLATGGSDFHGMYGARVNPLAARATQDGALAKFLERYDDASVAPKE